MATVWHPAAMRIPYTAPDTRPKRLNHWGRRVARGLGPPVPPGMCLTQPHPSAQQCMLALLLRHATAAIAAA